LGEEVIVDTFLSSLSLVLLYIVFKKVDVKCEKKEGEAKIII